MNIKLPKLKKTTLNRTKKKILLLTDDIFSPSGVGTMARELVFGTADRLDWVQIAAAIEHPHAGKMIDVSADVEKATGFDDLYVRLYPQSGYFDRGNFYRVMEAENPDAVMIFTDPRHYMAFWPHEHTIRTVYKKPIIYWSIWDSELVPMWNEPFYKSCDLLLAINKQTHLIHNELVKSEPYTNLSNF
jgi:hypothetical protein